MRWRERFCLAVLALCAGTLFTVRAANASEGTTPAASPNSELLLSYGEEGASSNAEYAPLYDPTARAACVARVAASRAPLLVAVGASFTAGLGAPSPRVSWAVDLAHLLGWRAVVAGVSDVGYLHRGGAHAGPLRAVLPMIDLPRLRPRLVIIQAGHDDMHEPKVREASAVRSLWRQLERELPHSTLAAITVFARGATPSAAAKTTDRTIVRAIDKVDPRAIVMDPLTAHWTFARSADRLHPSLLGHLEIAHLAAAHLTSAGVAPATAQAAPVCVLTKPYPLGHAS